MTLDMQTPAKKRKRSDSVQSTPSIKLLVKRLSDKAKLPTRGSLLAAGYDLYRYPNIIRFQVYRVKVYQSAEKKKIPARGKALVDTQLSIAVPLGTYGRVAPRSGLGKRGRVYVALSQCKLAASKFMIDTGAGVIDGDYRGPVFVLLFNLSDKDFEGKLPRAFG